MTYAARLPRLLEASQHRLKIEIGLRPIERLRI